MPYESFARFKLLHKSSWQKKIQNKSNIRYFCVLCNVFSYFRCFHKFISQKFIDLPVQSDNLNPYIELSYLVFTPQIHQIPCYL